MRLKHGCKSLVALSYADGPKIIGAEDVPRYHCADRVWDRLENRRCSSCCRQFGLDGSRLRVCGRCGVTPYCGVECQRAQWERHRPPCSHHWKAIRRECDLCGAIAADSDPPFPTCHCGRRRYCGEECQAKDWAAGHARKCKSGYLYLQG